MFYLYSISTNFKQFRTIATFANLHRRVNLWYWPYLTLGFGQCWPGSFFMYVLHVIGIKLGQKIFHFIFLWKPYFVFAENVIKNENFVLIKVYFFKFPLSFNSSSSLKKISLDEQSISVQILCIAISWMPWFLGGFYNGNTKLNNNVNILQFSLFNDWINSIDSISFMIFVETGVWGYLLIIILSSKKSILHANRNIIVNNKLYLESETSGGIP